MLFIDRNEVSALVGGLQHAAEQLQQCTATQTTTVEACLKLSARLIELSKTPLPKPLEEVWSLEYSRAACQEGWDLFECGSALVQIQRDDDISVFTDDAAAVAHVLERATAGSALHRRAMLIALGVL